MFYVWEYENTAFIVLFLSLVEKINVEILVSHQAGSSRWIGIHNDPRSSSDPLDDFEKSTYCIFAKLHRLN